MNEPFLIKNEITIESFQEKFTNLKKNLIMYYLQLIDKFKLTKVINRAVIEKVLTLPRELLIFEYKNSLILRIEDHHTPWGREISLYDINFDYYSFETCLEIVQRVDELYRRVNSFRN